MKTLRTWPRLPMIAFVAALLAGVSAAMFVSHRRSASLVVAPNAADVKGVDDHARIDKGSPGAANKDRSGISASSPVSATDRPLPMTAQQPGDRPGAKRQGQTQSKSRNANRSRVEFKGPHVRKP